MKRNRLIKILCLAMALALTMTTVAFAASVPGDVSGKPYEKAVTTLVDKNIITGDTDGLFHPNDNLTRAQSCVIIVKAMNPPIAAVEATASQPVKKSGFSDMSGYGWAEGYIAYAVDKDVTNGYPDGTFKPGDKVRMTELVTMVLRAAGYTDKVLDGTWPDNYMAKAEELNAFDGVGSDYPEYATKWMAAQVTFNLLEEIEKANEQETPDPGDGGGDVDVPEQDGLVYGNGSFNENMATYDGKNISSKVKVYTYMLKKDYSQSMKLSDDSKDYREDNVYRYKNVSTPAWYRLEDGKIVELILPKDVGFSGRVYGVITGTGEVLDSSDNSVDAVETLTAGRTVIWPCKSSVKVPNSSDYSSGILYELAVTNGVVTNIATSTDASKKNSSFEIIESGTVVEYSDGIITIDVNGNDSVFPVKSEATVYALDKNGEYEHSRLNNLKKGASVDLYDVSNDKSSSVDVVIVK